RSRGRPRIASTSSSRLISHKRIASGYGAVKIAKQREPVTRSRCILARSDWPLYFRSVGLGFCVERPQVIARRAELVNSGQPRLLKPAACHHIERCDREASSRAKERFFRLGEQVRARGFIR